MNTQNLDPSYLSHLCFQFPAVFLTWLWTFWLCPSPFSCLCLKNPVSYPKHKSIAFPKSQVCCVSLLLSKTTGWKLSCYSNFSFHSDSGSHEFASISSACETCDNTQPSLIKIKASWAHPHSICYVFQMFLLAWIFLDIFIVITGCQMHVMVAAFLTQCLQRNCSLDSTLITSMIKVVSWRLCNHNT